MKDNLFRQLPSVNDLLEVESVKCLLHAHSHERIVAALRAELADLREQIRQGITVDSQSAPEVVAARVATHLAQQMQPKLRTVINATGIVLHTNLGRSPIAEEAARAAHEAAHGYLNLELDLDTG